MIYRFSSHLPFPSTSPIEAVWGTVYIHINSPPSTMFYKCLHIFLLTQCGSWEPGKDDSLTRKIIRHRIHRLMTPPPQCNMHSRERFRKEREQSMWIQCSGLISMDSEVPGIVHPPLGIRLLHKDRNKKSFLCYAYADKHSNCAKAG